MYGIHDWDYDTDHDVDDTDDDTADDATDDTDDTDDGGRGNLYTIKIPGCSQLPGPWSLFDLVQPRISILEELWT